MAATKFPQAFREVEDLAAYDKENENHEAGLSACYDEMKRIVSGSDIVISDSELTPEQRESGLVRGRFRRFPEIIMVAGRDWPKQLVRAALDRQNEKLAKAA